MRLLDTAEIKDIDSLISNNNRLNIKVNFYQRPYRWTAKKVTDLFDDFKENLATADVGSNTIEYFLGAVVLVDERTQSEKDEGRVWKYQVVDGQQRFTTLYLFNYIKYILLVRKVDLAARMNRSRDFTAGLGAMEDCYRGFIGSKNVETIIQANQYLSNAFDTANQNRVPIDNDDLDQWRTRVGWIANPDIFSENYYENCRIAMEQFLSNETLSISYENQIFNTYLKEALTCIVIKFSDASDAMFCEEPIEDYDENDDSRIEFPYVARAYGIFEQVKKMYQESSDNQGSSYDKLCGYISIIDKMLENIKLCMIVTSDEDDAYKLFETLNDRSESVNDLELLKNYFFKTYSETSGEEQMQVYTNISALDARWRNVFFKYEDLESEVFEYMTVLFSGNTGKNTNEKRRKLIKGYLSEYNSDNRYTYKRINRDFQFMEYIQVILLQIHRMDMTAMCKSKEDSQLSLYIENDPNASIVKRTLGLAINLQYSLIVGSLICDIIHNFESNGQNMHDFTTYLDCIFSENKCKEEFPGLWKDFSTMWKVIVLSKNYESPKLLSDLLASQCCIKKMNDRRLVSEQIVQFNANVLEEDEVIDEFDEWINEWKFSDGRGKIKIKNLFMHLFLKYDLDVNTDELVLAQNIVRSYATEAISQDLDHMDANKVNRQNGNEVKYFHYNLSDRTMYTNGLGNMMPLPVAINRGKHNTPMEDTLSSLPKENLVGWIFDMAQEEFNKHHTIVNGHSIPTEEFFTSRKDRLISFFKRIVMNQKYSPASRI